ncbi:hypothetical protein EZS27_006158 [termite gut metagenome]|uniref:Uncharacterized protein n=1 Tax=termite gut metagenome TaxID=433724 RepID=A0A5J4SLP2_9ZZZZ
MILINWILDRKIFSITFVENLTIKMSEGVYIEGSERMSAFQKLKIFLVNPGRFCLIVIGKRGTGKHFSIEKAFEEIKQQITEEDEQIDLCFKNLIFLAQQDIPENVEQVDELFKKNEYHTVVIEDVDRLNEVQQKLLFDALSTGKGAKFGIKEKKYKLRFVFTSSTDSDTLRQDGEKLQGYFWDRISQLIVKMPSYNDDKNYIMKDFHYTWKKMGFQKIEKYKCFSGVPKNTKLEKRVEDSAEKLEGGFRDLDKLVCLYFNYRIFHYGEKKKISDEIEDEIVVSVCQDFFSKSRLLGDSDNDFGVFRFEIGKTGTELLKTYKAQLKKWAAKEYGNIGKAEEKLGFKKGTMKNYGKK